MEPEPTHTRVLAGGAGALVDTPHIPVDVPRAPAGFLAPATPFPSPVPTIDASARAVRGGCTTGGAPPAPSGDAPPPPTHGMRDTNRGPMPRNPHKTRCTVPGCRNWAMRDHTRCRAHRNADLGPGSGSGGAPAGNLNALKTGRRAHPLDGDQLSAANDALFHDPADLPARMAALTALLLSRTGEPFLLLVALRATISQLIDACAGRIFERELADALAPLPASLRARHYARICALAAALDPEQRLWMLRDRIREKKKIPVKTITGTGTPPTPRRSRILRDASRPQLAGHPRDAL